MTLPLPVLVLDITGEVWLVLLLVVAVLTLLLVLVLAKAGVGRRVGGTCGLGGLLTGVGEAMSDMTLMRRLMPSICFSSSRSAGKVLLWVDESYHIKQSVVCHRYVAQYNARGWVGLTKCSTAKLRVQQ